MFANMTVKYMTGHFNASSSNTTFWESDVLIKRKQDSII